MSKSTKKQCPDRTLLIASIIFFTIIGGGKQLFSQCPPTSQSNEHWAKGATVYYNLSNVPEPMKSQIQAGINEWDAKNRDNGSNISFVSGSPPDGPSPCTPQLSFVIGGSNGNDPAWYQNDVVEYATNSIISSTITFYTDGKYTDSNGVI